MRKEQEVSGGRDSALSLEGEKVKPYNLRVDIENMAISVRETKTEIIFEKEKGKVTWVVLNEFIERKDGDIGSADVMKIETKARSGIKLYQVTSVRALNKAMGTPPPMIPPIIKSSDKARFTRYSLNANVEKVKFTEEELKSFKKYPDPGVGIRKDSHKSAIKQEKPDGADETAEIDKGQYTLSTEEYCWLSRMLLSKEGDILLHNAKIPIGEIQKREIGSWMTELWLSISSPPSKLSDEVRRSLHEKVQGLKTDKKKFIEQNSSLGGALIELFDSLNDAKIRKLVNGK